MNLRDKALEESGCDWDREIEDIVYNTERISAQLALGKNIKRADRDRLELALRLIGWAR